MNCIFQSEIYELEDCIYYDAMTSASGDWDIPSAVSSSSTFGYSSDGWKFGNVSSYQHIYLNKSISVGFGIGSNRMCQLKNFKIKPL